MDSFQLRARMGSLAWCLMCLTTVAAAGPDAREQDLAKQVSIRRDKWGVPHILAPTEEAAAFGHGYAMAEDHCLVVARLFLQARNEESAYFGEKFAAADLLGKELHIYKVAEEGYAKSPPWMQRILDGYAAGFSHYITQHRAELPDWVKPVTGVDILAHARHGLLTRFAMDLGQLEAIGAKKAALAPLGEAAYRGSNMWAIGKERSKSGKGILMGNPHQPWSGSGVFWEVHITVPDKYNVRGCAVVGSPVIGIGFNENLGWSHTVNLHDSDDVYELTLDPQDAHRYVYDGASVAMRKEQVEIQVKTKNGPKQVKKDLYWSHYGPVLKWINGKAYAFKSANIDEYRFLEQWFLMGKARSLIEFRKVLDMQAVPMFNICYADKEGNCFYLFNGRFPDRPSGFRWDGVVPGNTSASEWNHMLPQSRLPGLVNPKGGFVQNCNAAPWYTTPHARVDRRDYPPELTPNFNSLRQQLSVELLKGTEALTLERIMELKYDTKMLLADRVKADVIKAIRSGNAPELEEAANVLDAWDNTSSRASTGSVLFAHFWRKYASRARKPYARDWLESQAYTTPRGIGEPATVCQAMAEAAKEIKMRYGKLDVAWGEIHRLRRGSVDLPLGGFMSEFRDGFRGGLYGDFGSFRVIGFEVDKKDGKYIGAGGDSFVLAVEFTTPPRAHSIVAYSQSDDPKSPHYADQSVLFASEKWKPAWFTEEDIAKNLERSYHP